MAEVHNARHFPYVDHFVSTKDPYRGRDQRAVELGSSAVHVYGYVYCKVTFVHFHFTNTGAVLAGNVRHARFIRVGVEAVLCSDLQCSGLLFLPMIISHVCLQTIAAWAGTWVLGLQQHSMHQRPCAWCALLQPRGTVKDLRVSALSERLFAAARCRTCRFRRMGKLCYHDLMQS